MTVKDVLEMACDAKDKRIADLEAESKGQIYALEQQGKQLKKAQDELAEEREVLIVRPMAEWHEDCGPVLWWHFPVCEPPEVGYGPGSGKCNSDGTPTGCAKGIESGWLTHWSHIPVVWDASGQPLLCAALDAAGEGGAG